MRNSTELKHSQIMKPLSQPFVVILNLMSGLFSGAVCMAQAAAPLPTQPGVGFAMLGVAAGQSLISPSMASKLLALNTGYTTTSSQRRCRLTFQVYDSQGQLLKEKAVADLTQGHSAMLDWNRNDLPGNDRAEIRAVLRFGYSGGANPPPGLAQPFTCTVRASVQIVDNLTGRVTFVSSDAKPLPEPTVPAQ